MPRLLVTISLICVTFLAVIMLVNLRASHNESALFEVVKTQAVELMELEVQNIFQELDNHLHQASKKYLTIHAELARKASFSKKLDVLDLRAEFFSRFGQEIDVFVIDDNYVITQSTFEPDLGLDFKLEQFLDAQIAFKKAKQTGDIVVGVPTKEFVSGKFKTYTVSTLDSGGYIQVGFIDSNLAALFENKHRAIERIKGIDSAILYMDSWGKFLAPLSAIPAIKGKIVKNLNKTELMALSNEYFEEEYKIFKSVSSENPVEIPIDESENSKYIYLELMTKEFLQDINYRYLAKIKFNIPSSSWIDRNITLITSITLFTIFALLSFVIFEIRTRILIPLNNFITAVELESDVDLNKHKFIPEKLHFLMHRYNEYRQHMVRLNNSLHQMAMHDPLTKLLNRASFSELHTRAMGNAVRNGKLLAVVFLDLDRFKEYNDIYGHQAGDEVLIILSKVIQETFRRPSDLAIRFGGEEFVIYFETESFFTAKSQLEKLKASLKDLSLAHIGNVPYQIVTFSAGMLVCKPDYKISSKDVIKLADESLYEAKKTGRNEIVCRDFTVKPLSTRDEQN